MAFHSNRDSWLKIFLEPLNNNWYTTPSTRTEETSNVGVDSLVCKFSNSLHENYLEENRLKAKNLSFTEGYLTDLLQKPSGAHPEQLFKELKKRWQLYEEALSSKSDREKSGSAWTIEMLERYIKREDIIFVQLESRFDLTGALLQNICERVHMAIKAVCGLDGTVENLQPSSTESETRMILDAILQPLCVYKGLTVRSEQTIKSDALPTNKYDYIMYYKVDKPIGVVEAKRQGYLKDDSVAQLLVQLLLLSSVQPNWFYFGVLTDAHQFIFTGVSQKRVLFFQTNEKRLETTTVKSDNDVRSIVSKISWLIDLAIQSRSSHHPIDALLAPVAAWKIKE